MSQATRQTPGSGEIYLDHVGWFVPDIGAASAVFERLGFVLTPFVASRNASAAGGPPQLAGTGNRCAMLPLGYIEIIAGIHGVDTPLALQVRTAVAHHVGVHVVAFTVADAQAAHQRLAAEGFEPLDPVWLRRPVPAPDGGETEAAFTVVRVPADKMPEGRIQVLTQETPDLVWQPRFIARGHGLSALAGVLLCVADPAEAAARYARFLNRPAKGGPDYYTITLDRGRLGFATRERCETLLSGPSLADSPGIAAVALAAANPAATMRFCRERQVALRFGDDRRCCIDPGAAMGTAVLVHGRDDVWPPDA
ncbi:MAG: VOC family protein [Gemmatimonadetes bacterium]|nr:VOC family protein [Gemmatimonadota bacterium]